MVNNCICEHGIRDRRPIVRSSLTSRRTATDVKIAFIMVVHVAVQHAQQVHIAFSNVIST